MTREKFEETFLLQYNTLCRLAEKRCKDSGSDIVHTAYALVIENETYKKAKPKYAKQWIYFKVAREISRSKKRQFTHSKLLQELRHEGSNSGIRVYTSPG
jgi:hypothetical protein